jgi:hypothetical protein
LLFETGIEGTAFDLSQFVSSLISNTSSLSSSGASSVTGKSFSSDGFGNGSICFGLGLADSCRHVLKAEPAKP